MFHSMERREELPVIEITSEEVLYVQAGRQQDGKINRESGVHLKRLNSGGRRSY